MSIKSNILLSTVLVVLAAFFVVGIAMETGLAIAFAKDDENSIQENTQGAFDFNNQQFKSDYNCNCLFIIK
jgi:sensor domain CHASE-containing protein